MGSQTPTRRICPNYDYSDGPTASKLLKVGGTILDPWQDNLLNDWMALNPSGLYVCKTCGISIPRQNGKSGELQGRAEAGMIKRREKIVYTAHLQKTATETFEEMAVFFDSNKLRKYVKDIKTALGREQIILKNGARVKFLARTRNGGRGQHGDVLMFDEAQELDTDQQASFLPAISASLNPQTIYAGTPPDPNTPGDVFKRIRAKALSGETTTSAWVEFSVDEIGDVHDVERWAATNPALGRRILLSTIEGECEQMDPDTFARERLGWWAPEQVKEEIPTAISEDDWDACASFEPKPEGKTAYGVKFSADGSEVCLCGAVVPKDGKCRITLLDRKPTGLGTQWLADWLNARYKAAACVVIDGRNGVDVLVDKISETWRYKGAIVRPTAKDMIAAVSCLMDGINEQTLTWYAPQEDLKNSAITSTKRKIGSQGGWGFGGDDSTPIEACALALWGAKNTKRDPSRKMRFG
ncbi:MAG: hypothetical protein IIY21_28090 [Clostridiales bacterium]|nr:hypothetical protein [Clostridiales bacterium]MBQ1570442.1 hypothetical protein [Clostridiales bacterium]